MTQPDPETVGRIVKGLTEAQRDAIINARTLSGPCADMYADDDDYSLYLADLVTAYERLTPLGLAVRASLADASEGER